jgi:hypothetical protein
MKNGPNKFPKGFKILEILSYIFFFFILLFFLPILGFTSIHVESVDGREWATNHANTVYRGPDSLCIEIRL